MSALSDELTETISNIVHNHPLFAVYLYDQMNIVDLKKDAAEAKNIRTAATDGKSIYFNSDWFASLRLPNRVFVAVHEIGHGILGHMKRYKLYAARGFGPDLKPFNVKKWMQACDYVLNAILVEAGIGTMPTGDNQGLYHPDYTSNMTADEVYLLLDDPEDDDEDNFDDHHEPADDLPDDAEHENAVAKARNSAKAQGKLPANIGEVLGEMLEPEQPWRELLRDVMMVITGDEELSYAKANRRKLVLPPHMIWPSGIGFNCRMVICIEDISGSVCEDESQVFRGEEAGILEDCKPEVTHILWTDTEVRDPILTIEDGDFDALRNAKRPMGGGTHMPAAFNYIAEQGWTPDVVVVLTDGWTDYGEEPPYPVVWVTTDKADIPFGRVIKANLKE